MTRPTAGPARDTDPPVLLPGRDEPLGAVARDGGVNVAVFSAHATRIDLCLYDAAGDREEARLALHGPDDGVFHGFLPGAGPGLVYGLRAHGPWAPGEGHRFDAAKLLLDPWAREIVGTFAWHDSHFTPPEGPGASADNGARALKARVPVPAAEPAPGWHNRPRHAAADVVLYEAHVKGFTATHPGIPPALRGTYAGLAHPAAIAHLRGLGVTTLSLLPVHYALDEAALAARGLANYWGYNTLGFFCPDPRLAAARGDPAAVADEFRRMVATLHDHGLEVVLDVVFNHTAESDEAGPTLAFRGLDNASWYRLPPHDRARYENDTGCGNTLAAEHPRVTQFVMDALRHWAFGMGVDGFRFDLAPVLGRRRHGFDPHAPFFAALRQDPVLAGVRWIAEPWDVGPGGYQLGRFPGRFLEWNDRFRDAVRRYWLGVGTGRAEFARRFAASSDVFHHGDRRPHASVNFVAAHDGFTLADAVSHGGKHNEANGEGNRDGRDDEPCGNFGVEGPAAPPAIARVRDRARRALTATLLLAQGTPMLCAGDEIGRTQGGNNNAYCQDNALGWLDWSRADAPFRDFVAAALALRRAEPLLRHDRWFPGPGEAAGGPAMAWYAPEGHEMRPHDWHHGPGAFACRIAAGDPPPADGAAHLLLLFQPEADDVGFRLPGGPWAVALDSGGERAPGTVVPAGEPLAVPGRTLLVLRSPEIGDRP